MKHVRAVLPLTLLWAPPAMAQTPPSDPAARSSEVLNATEDVVPDPPANEAAASPAPAAKFSLDTPIADLIANWRSKAVLDKDLPGLSFDKNLDKFSHMSLRQLQPQSDGRLTDALMEQVGADLAAIK